MRTLVINSSHYVAGSSNTFSYPLPYGTKFADNSKIGVASISLYNSTFNITSARGNNTITLTSWAGVSLSSNNVITIPDGYYSVSDLNYYIQN